MAEGKHLFPFRTEKLSPPAPMVLPGKPGGRVGRRPFSFEAPASRRGLEFFAPPERQLAMLSPGHPTRAAAYVQVHLSDYDPSLGHFPPWFNALIRFRFAHSVPACDRPARRLLLLRISTLATRAGARRRAPVAGANHETQMDPILGRVGPLYGCRWRRRA